MIQDVVLSLGGALLALTLFPTLRDRRSVVPLATSVPVSLVLAAFSATYVTLGMPLAAVTTGATAAMWIGVAAWRH